MRFFPFDLERWQSTWETRVRFNLSESGVHPLSVQELLGIAAAGASLPAHRASPGASAKPSAEGPKAAAALAPGEPLPPGAIARIGNVRFSPGDMVNSVAFSPDGKTLASGNNDSTVRLWERSTGKEVRVFRGHRDAVQWVAFSPDGKLLASISSKQILLGLKTVNDLVKAERVFEALKGLRALFPVEDAILTQQAAQSRSN